MLLLQLLQLVEEPVVLRVRDLGVVEHVVAVVVMVQDLPQLRGARGLGLRGRQGAPPASRRPVRLLRLEPLARVNAAPRDRDRMHSCGLGGTDVERRVADVRRVVPVGAQELERVCERRRIGLVPLGVVRADDDVEEPLQRQIGEGQPHRLAPLRSHDAEPSPLLLERRQDIGHARTLDELGVQRLVVLAVAGDELIGPIGRDQLHLLHQPGAPDRAPELVVRDIPAEHCLRRVPHRRDDDRAGVDHGAVEVEENDREAHQPDRIRAGRLSDRRPGQRGGRALAARPGSARPP